MHLRLHFHDWRIKNVPDLFFNPFRYDLFLHTVVDLLSTIYALEFHTVPNCFSSSSGAQAGVPLTRVGSSAWRKVPLVSSVMGFAIFHAVNPHRLFRVESTRSRKFLLAEIDGGHSQNSDRACWCIHLFVSRHPRTQHGRLRRCACHVEKHLCRVDISPDIFSKNKHSENSDYFEAYHELRRSCQLLLMSKQHCFHCRCLLLEDMVDSTSNMASAVHGGVACFFAVLVLRRIHRAHSICRDYDIVLDEVRLFCF